MERELISFMFVGGTLMFLFGALVLEKAIMWIPAILSFLMAGYIATMKGGRD